MPVKRIRVFAGPNGSGKTTIIKSLKSLEKEVPLGVYINADDIELSLENTKQLDFSFYKLQIEEVVLHEFFSKSTFSPVKRNEKDLWSKLKVEGNILFVSTFIDSYLAADLAEFIRQKLMSNGVSFSYETVMSHPGKVDFLQKARLSGYRVYLYYIATEDPDINIGRVIVRVSMQGHAVAPQVIRDRYYKRVSLLKLAIKQTNRAYVFDSTQNGVGSLLIAEISNGTDVTVIDVDKVPEWFVKYVYE